MMILVKSLNPDSFLVGKINEISLILHAICFILRFISDIMNKTMGKILIKPVLCMQHKGMLD